MNSSPHWIDHIVKQINGLITKTGVILTAFGHDAMPESMASNELLGSEEPEHLRSAYSQGTLLIEATMDHFLSFSRAISLPVLTISPWTCIRSLLEAASLSAWLLDPEIDSYERATRSFQFRCEGLSQQLRFARVAGLETDLAAIEARFNDVLREAEEFGLEVVRSASGERKHLRYSLPSATDLASNQFDEEAAYRMLSAVTHAHPWALQQLGFRRADEEDRLLLQKDLKPTSIAYLGNIAFSKSPVPILKKCELFGWPQVGIAELFDEAFVEFARITTDIVSRS